MRRADRLFQLVQILRTRRFATGEELAIAVGVSKRTLYRDVQDLIYSGVPIKGEAGVGYRLERGFELPPLTFTGEELEALALGARFIAAWGDAELANTVGAAMTKIEAVIPAALRRSLLDTPLFVPGFERSAEMARNVGPLRRAISQHRTIRFGYRKEDGDETIREARPLGLYFWGNRWTLASWCELREDFRSFRPDRMNDLKLLERSFDPETGPNLDQFIERTEWLDDVRGTRTPSLER
jgi:predicted DNA-binding transcriptional regulator YafY